VGSLKAKQIGKLQPTYQGAADNAENYGCGVLSDGRIVTSDIGNQAQGDGDGQLIIWFPPFTKGFRTLANGTEGKVSYCKLDIGIATAGGIAVDDDDNLYVASARGATAGVNRYPGPFPTSATPAGGCDGTDSTGAPMATNITREPFIATTDNLGTPNAIVPAPTAGPKQTGWYVSSVFTGVINEYDTNGAFVRTILQPPAGETLGAAPFSTGTPLGLGIAPDGTLYYADIGIVVSDKGIGPGRGTGTVRRITFVDGDPQAPETMASGLAFPDGIGIFVPRRP
jgi:sugar lactone lactonase YvrE